MPRSFVILVQRVVNHVDFRKWDVVFVVDNAFGGFGNGDNAVGLHQAFVFDFVDERISDVHASTIKFGSMNVGN